MTTKKPRLWHGRRDPYLYQASVEVLNGKAVTDQVVQPLGVRYFSVDANNGFFLNGESYRLHGVNRHQDREDKGWAIGISEHKEDYKLIEEMGCTTVRLAHYQQAKEFYELCDRGGMVVWAELALVDEVNASPEFGANCQEQLEELIKQNCNHPSIVFWSIFNELMPDANRPLYAKIVNELNSLAKTLDPTRLSTKLPVILLQKTSHFPSFLMGRHFRLPCREKVGVRCAFFLCLIICFMFTVLDTSSFALDDPPLRGYVNDYAGMISPQAKTSLESELRAFEQTDSTQIVILTIPSLEGGVLEEFSIKVAEAWKIGQKVKDNGAIFLVAQQEDPDRSRQGTRRTID